eukprot:scaffold40102_cov54-Phaeocystis_antarctica.AAC.6
MSEMAETSQSAMGPYVAVAAVASLLNAWTAAFREAVLVKVPGGGDGGNGGGGGECGGAGGGGGEGGEGGEGGGWNCTTKDLVPCLGPFSKAKFCPKPGAAHSAPSQPFPYESVISRVHVAPSATANGWLEVYGAPPLSVVLSEQLRLQPTSLGYDPPEQVIAEVAWLASQPPSHDASISSSAVRQAPRVRPWQAARGRRRQPLCTSAPFSLDGRCCGRGSEVAVGEASGGEGQAGGAAQGAAWG